MNPYPKLLHVFSGNCRLWERLQYFQGSKYPLFINAGVCDIRIQYVSVSLKYWQSEHYFQIQPQAKDIDLTIYIDFGQGLLENKIDWHNGNKVSFATNIKNRSWLTILNVSKNQGTYICVLSRLQLHPSEFWYSQLKYM